MNAVYGVMRFDGVPIDREKLAQCIDQSPQWKPDHQGVFVEGNVGFACTQRFITTDCGHAPMPYRHKASGCVVVGAIYLMQRENLMKQLQVALPQSDAELVLLAYLKWGTSCAQHLTGSFMFSIWDPQQQKLLVVVSHFGDFPCLYAYQDGQYFIFANTIEPFRALCPKLTVNESLFTNFTLDYMPAEDTCYSEIKKMPPAYVFVVTPERIRKRQYWQLQKQKNPLLYKTRDDYYEAFREIFEKSVNDCLRSDHPITAHLSGGLDSSSVAAVAAKLLAKQNKTLHGFTAVPQNLEGPSFNKNWYYHEMPRVQTVLDQYPNIVHHLYRGSSERDLFHALSQFYPFTDQPFRNVSNFDWILGGFETTLANGGRTILNGDMGNGSISWRGAPPKKFLSTFTELVRLMRLWRNPTLYFDGYFKKHNTAFLRKLRTKNIICRPHLLRNLHHDMLAGTFLASRFASIFPIALWYGVLYIDPTHTLPLVEFCYNVPQWVYFKGSKVLEKRLLVREGLEGLVPHEIRMNPFRGEQAADWYVPYNTYYKRWRDELLEMTEGQTDPLLWKLYDRKSMLELFQPVEGPNHESYLHICCNLMRCLGCGFFLDYAQKHGR